MSRVLPIALAACALAAAFAARAIGFVVLPPSSSRATQPQLRAPARDAAPLEKFLPSYAEPEVEQGPSALKWLGAGLLGGLIIAVSSAPVSAKDAAKDAAKPAAKAVAKEPQRDFAIKPSPQTFTPDKFTIKNAKALELCKSNKKYAKKFKDRLYKMTNREKKYPKGTVVNGRFQERIAALKRRNDAFGDRLCGKVTGLPVTIASGELVRGGIVPASLAFLYIAGWIGWAGRSYMIRKAGREQEIMINIPLALTCMTSGFAWPVAAWQEIVNGELVESDENIYRSGAGFWAGGRRG